MIIMKGGPEMDGIRELKGIRDRIEQILKDLDGLASKLEKGASAAVPAPAVAVKPPMAPAPVEL